MFSIKAQKYRFGLGFPYLKSASAKDDCSKMERNVPVGISFRLAGTIVVRVGSPFFLNLM